MLDLIAIAALIITCIIYIILERKIGNRIDALSKKEPEPGVDSDSEQD